MSVGTGTWPARAGHFLLRELRLILPPTIYFFCAFNLIVMTTNLLAHSYWFALSGFLTTSLLALLVGKAVLVVNKFRLIDRFRSAPLIKPILYKTIFYSLVVMLFRIIELLIHFSFDGHGFRVALREAADAFTWHHFATVQIWLFICFLIYVTAVELSRALGPGTLKQLLFGLRAG